MLRPRASPGAFLYLTVMKMLITIIIAVAFAQSGFNLTGTITGFEEGTLIYLDDLSDGSFRHMDSTYLRNGKFSFSGKLPVSPLRAAIRTKDINYRCYVWLENTEMVFAAYKEDFRNGVLAGSKAQNEAHNLQILVKAAKDPREAERAFVRTHPNSIISANLLSIYCSTWGKDTTEALYKKLTAEVKESFYGKQVYDYITSVKNIKIGDAYVDFSQPDTKGQQRKLSDLEGKVVLLEFWGSWCGPCRAGNPELVKIYNEFKSKGFEIFGVAAETQKSQWLDAIEKDQLPWINVTDLNGDKNKAALIYNVSYYPTNFLIDSKGIIVGKDLKGDKLRAKLKELL